MSNLPTDYLTDNCLQFAQDLTSIRHYYLT
jgi:hypothetical protein